MPQNLVNTYSNKKVLITGHTGFKGSWLTAYLNSLGAKLCGVALAPNTTPNHFNLLQKSKQIDIEHIELDIRDSEGIKTAFRQFNPDIVFHLAAQPLVRKSYTEPKETFETNVIGTLNVYEATRLCTHAKAVASITTDKVYENKEWNWGYREEDRLGGHDPYSASKACAEILSSSYRNSFLKKDSEILLATVRAGNVIGGGDWALDRLIPDIVAATQSKEKVVIRNPSSIRPWQHVLDPVYGYLEIGRRLLNREENIARSWNLGPVFEMDWSVLDVLKQSAEVWDEIRWDVYSNPNQLHESSTLKLDCSLATKYLSWNPAWKTKDSIVKTIQWYKSFYLENVLETEKDIKDFNSALTYKSN